jgi:hypothetical protein
MSEGEHTIIGKIPRERLNQIASRKLAALNVPVRLAADRESLEGELVCATLLHPATGAPLGRSRFQVVGHDRLRFLDPPLAALEPVLFYEQDRLAGLEQAVGAALTARSAQVQGLAARLRGLRQEPVFDPDRLVVRAVVKTTSHAFELMGGAGEVRISRVAPVGGKPWEVSTGFPPLELERFDTSTDLELWLLDALPRMAARPEAGASRPAGVLEATPPPRNSLTLESLARTFGAEAMLAPSAQLEIVQEFRHGGTHYRFVAVRESSALFRGRLIGPSGDVWSDRFDLAHFPGTAVVVAAALGLEPPGQEAASAPGEGGQAVPHHLQPVVGEVWVMSVVVEQEGPDEVRYVGTDIDGRPYGAARVLSRVDFETVFSMERGTWRLLIRIDQVQDGVVLYRQMDRQRQPIGAPRRIPAAILVANFVPEAAAY